MANVTGLAFLEQIREGLDFYPPSLLGCAAVIISRDEISMEERKELYEAFKIEYNIIIKVHEVNELEKIRIKYPRVATELVIELLKLRDKVSKLVGDKEADVAWRVR